MADLEKIVSLAKRRGFVFPGSEIYGGLAGTWDLGPLGAELAHNIKELWWEHFVKKREDMFGLASGVLMPEKVWVASGHLEGFSDPLGEGQRFNLMFKTEIGAVQPEKKAAYLRPEIAQGMFVNFKNVLDTMRPALPFGIAQIGRAFRNEIAPRDFLFRVREFDLMEFEYFAREAEWEKYFEFWRTEMWAWIENVGIDKEKVHELEVQDGERAHYSKRTIDFEFDWPFGKKELYGLAYRGDYDLNRHMEYSGVDLRYADPVSGEKFIPHVIEPTFGLGRTILAVLLSAYREDEDRIILSLPPKIAPVKVAVFPLVSNKENLVKKAREIYENLKLPTSNFSLPVVWDNRGNIGKRYYAQDEIGTPWCVTIDYQTLEDNTITIRDRDTGKQERHKVSELGAYFIGMLFSSHNR
ncbi:glycine--tRNA ligase [Candidatus Giovannonibacteria bacterium RIFCSPLOWO2_01_FULL_46_32]|uniref:Glycine--tRNA ligase n=1 Tax=Candidatus Giovannonibacteria bacterium RIFCSPLOWO2_01_FULL_46_32 TaxID=1798353 RepID=A0A1F5XI79_9BACT|nr:MAG: glycine--tRNA ligase [Candidatus Giovannonibacteria bacterium RIFCSPLOWO2_01_FULL_46_32]